MSNWSYSGLSPVSPIQTGWHPMSYIIIALLSCITIITPIFYRLHISHEVAQESDMVNSDQENNIHNPLLTVEGVITKVTFGNLSKTNRVKRLVMHLYLKTPSSPDDNLKLRRYPALETDQQLHVGQHVSIIARKVKNEFNEFSEYLEIIHIEPL